MAQYRYFDRDIKRFPYSYGADKEERYDDFIGKLKVGEIFIHSNWVQWASFKENFEKRGVIIERYQFKQKRMARDFKDSVSIVLQKGEDIYDFPDAKEEQMFDENSLMA